MGPHSIQEGVRLALDQLRLNKLRSGLTILGLVVGVAVVMLMSAVVNGIQSSVVEALESAGPRNFIVSRFDFNAAFSSDGPAWEGRPSVTVEEAQLIGRLPGVEDAIVDFDFQSTLEVGQERISGVQSSADGAGWDAFTMGQFVSGHNFTQSDVYAARPVVVLSLPLAERLFGTLDPVGRRVRVDGRVFEVIGVFEVAENIFATIVKNFAIFPYTAATKHLNVDDEMLTILVVTADHATQDEAMDEVIATLRAARGLRPADENDFTVMRQEELGRTFTRVLLVFFIVMIALSSVALLVGGVGVIAIMMIAVTERTREIGVRKALGATPREILFQFLVESATLTLIGAGIGLIVGGGLATVVAALSPIQARVPAAAIAASLGMAVIAGVLFGLWPAYRAARLDPVEALRYE